MLIIHKEKHGSQLKGLQRDMWFFWFQHREKGKDFTAL